MITRLPRLAARVAVIGVVLTAAAAPAAAGPTDGHVYDDHFRKYSKRFFGVGFDWRLFKAQGLAESNLQPAAESQRGARGVMQLMPTTWAEVRLKNPEFRDIHDPEWNIAAGVWYCRWLWNSWRGDVDQAHHRQFMLASYNAGRATVYRAREVAVARLLNGRLWTSIEQVAHQVPRWAHRETLGYVDRVFDFLRSMDRQGRLRAR